MGRVHLTSPPHPLDVAPATRSLRAQFTPSRIRSTSSPPVASDFFARKNADNLATGGLEIQLRQNTTYHHLSPTPYFLNVIDLLGHSRLTALIITEHQ
jgi:hypothetical protein